MAGGYLVGPRWGALVLRMAETGMLKGNRPPLVVIPIGVFAGGI